MNFITVLIISSVLLGILMLGMGIKMLFDKKAEFSGGSCQASPELTERGITCGCGSNVCHNGNKHTNEKESVEFA